MKVILPAVQHTGSRLVASMFLGQVDIPQPGYFNRKNPEEKPSEGNDLFYAHPDIYNIGRFVILAKDNPTIVPLRHPLRCAYSWQNQNKDLKDWVTEWDLVINNIDILDPLYIRVDHKDRNEDLFNVNDSYGLKLDTKWPYFGFNSWPLVRNTGNNSPAIPELESIDLTEENLKIYSSFVRTRRKFFERFYDAC